MSYVYAAETAGAGGYFPDVWASLLAEVISFGHVSSPRGKTTRELCDTAFSISMKRPVLTIPERKLHYRFMAAEAFWILSGDDTTKGIVPWNPRVEQFSDDGIRFFGAYGPKVVGQLPYVLATLLRDRDSRQAGLTIWRESPPKTKDVPCTVAMFFRIRKGQLSTRVFMRSCDLWLGTPYDVFTFTMVSYLLCARLNAHGVEVVPGNLTLFSASSHLYDHDLEGARVCAQSKMKALQAAAPPELWTSEAALLARLAALRDSAPGASTRWWENAQK